MKLRSYHPADLEEIETLFYDTVHTVTVRDYTAAQRAAWASGKVDSEQWNASFLAHHTVIAEQDDQIIGFGDMDADGYLDRLYVHKEFQRQGIATAICDVLERAAQTDFFTVHASITARPFFEKRGYALLKEQQVERRGVLLTNFVMKKPKG
ncbi:MAG: GNAT family N-acetyltransferase [Firmicutes bacterium]|nr:GNAT family N-acetyltransferase [Bacillota bacterium]